MLDANGLISTRFGGKFDVISIVAEGSSTTVFRAYDTILERTVALKVVFPSGSEEHGSQQIERLQREAIALSRIAHPNTPTIYEAGQDPETGLNFAVLEWIPGQRLSRFARHPLSEEQILRLAHGISAGVAAAHKRNILHRDLHPDNVLVTTNEDGQAVAKLLDFGVAQFESETWDMARLTAPDEIMGSFSYISPEQARGDEVDKRTDVYSFGALLFELLSGRVPFEGTPMQVITAHLQEKRPSLNAKPGIDMSPLPRAVIKRCMELDPEKRFRDCAAVFEVIDNVSRERGAGAALKTVHAVTVDLNARYVVVGRADGTIDVYDQSTGQAFLHFEGHHGAVTALTFRPDTEEFLSAGEDGHIHLWSISENCRAGTWPGLRGRQFTLEFSPFGYIFASGETDGRIRLWSLLEQRPLGELNAHEGPVSALHFLPGGRFMASAGKDGSIRLWDVGSMELAEHCAWKRGAVSHFAMHVRERFVVAFEDGSLAMGRWRDDAPRWHRRVHEKQVTRLFEQHGGQGVFSIGLDGAIHCIDAFDGEPRRKVLHHLEGIRAAVLHPLSERLFASSDSVLLRWMWTPSGDPVLEGYLPAESKTGWVRPETPV